MIRRWLADPDGLLVVMCRSEIPARLLNDRVVTFEEFRRGAPGLRERLGVRRVYFHKLHDMLRLVCAELDLELGGSL